MDKDKEKDKDKRKASHSKALQKGGVDNEGKYIKLASESTSTAILAQETLVRPKKPGLDRQPKEAQARGKGGILKVTQKHKKDGNRKSFSQLAQHTSSVSIGERRMTKNDSDPKISTTVMAGVKGGRNSSAHKASLASVQSLGSSFNSEEEVNWETFSTEVANVFDEEGIEEQEPVYEMANVEIEVSEAQEEMEKLLNRMTREARTTEREKLVLGDTFAMFLQALIHMQEGEVEAIDHLQTKTGILTTIDYFIKSAEELKKHVAEKSEEKISEEDTGIGLLEAHGNEPEQVKAPEDDAQAKKPEETAQTEASGKETDEKSEKTVGGRSVDDMNTTSLRDTYLAQRNKLDMQAHLKNIHAFELKQIQFEKTLMDLHYSKMIKPADLQREMKDLRKAVMDMEMEYSVVKQETANVQAEIAVEEKLLRKDEVLTDRLDLEMLTKQLEVHQNANKPLHLAKEADKEAHKLEQLSDNLDQLSTRWMDGMQSVYKIQDLIDRKIAELQQLGKEEGKMYNNRKLSLHDAETLTADMENLLRKEQNLLDKCAACTESIALAGKMRKKHQEDLNHINNATNKSQRDYLRLERQVRSAHDSYINAKMAHEKMRTAYEITRPKQDTDQWEKLGIMFQREIANLKAALNSKINEASYSAAQVEKLQKKLNVLYDEQVTVGKELQDLIRMTVRKRRERQEKAEQCIKLEAQVYRLGLDKKMQKLVLDDCARSERDLHKIMGILRKKFNVLKIERAGLVTDLIQFRQYLSEYMEKIKISTNEVDSYNNQLVERTREIQRAHFVNLNAGLARDSVKNEALRSILDWRIRNKEKQELLLCNNNLRKEIDAQEKEVVEVRHKFENFIHESMKFATSFRDRTEEVCTFIERIKTCDLIIIKGKAEMGARELELTKLESIFKEIKNHVNIVTVNQPDEIPVVRDIERLRKRYFEITSERFELEAELNNVQDQSRRREIHHDLIQKRETDALLDDRLGDLEQALATRECVRLERDLIMQQVEDFTEDAILKANFLKRHYAKEVRQLVYLRKALYHTSNKIDGMICETSLANAKAETAEQRCEKFKQVLHDAEIRFQNGESPTDEIENEFKHIIWRDEMIQRSNNRPPGFLVPKTPLKGSRIVMERLRPKPKVYDPCNSIIPLYHVDPPLRCKKRPYRALKCPNPVTSSRGHAIRNKTGVGLCNMTLF